MEFFSSTKPRKQLIDTFQFYHHRKFMFKSPADAIPDEYRNIAVNLFPDDGYSQRLSPDIEKILAFADILQLGADNKKFISSPKSAKDMMNMMHSFQNNFDLLVQKTWVEKAEEIRKENLLDRLPEFIVEIEQEKYPEAIEEFGEILKELAWLFFGAQSRKDDFTEYTLRIDTQMGLFWWYGNQLCNPKTLEWIKRSDREILQAVLFLGICFLINF